MAAMAFCPENFPLPTGPHLKDASLGASTCLRGGLGLGEKVVIVSWNGTEVRTGVNHFAGELQEEPGSADLASGQWHEQK